MNPDTTTQSDIVQETIITRPSPYASAVVACIASVSITTLLHPLDLIKTRWQVASVANGAVPCYTSVYDALTHIILKEGFKGLYKGCFATIIASSISWGMFRYLYEKNYVFFRNSYFQNNNSFHGLYSFQKSFPPSESFLNLIASLSAGTITTLFVHPLWLLKTRLEMQAAETKAADWVQFRGWFHCFSSVYRREGIHGFYKGLIPAIGLVPQGTLQLIIYEKFKYNFIMQQKHPDVFTSSIKAFVPAIGHPFIWGLVSKFITVSLTYPLHVIRTRRQMARNVPLTYSEILKTSFKFQDALKTFYPGFLMHLQRSCLYNGLLFFIFENLLHVDYFKKN